MENKAKHIHNELMCGGAKWVSETEKGETDGEIMLLWHYQGIVKDVCDGKDVMEVTDNDYSRRWERHPLENDLAK